MNSTSTKLVHWRSSQHLQERARSALAATYRTPLDWAAIRDYAQSHQDAQDFFAKRCKRALYQGYRAAEPSLIFMRGLVEVAAIPDTV